MRPRFFLILCLLATTGLALCTTSCSSPTATATATVETVKPTINKGLCQLVVPSVIATVLSTSMKLPTTLAHGSTTECTYLPKGGGNSAVLVRYDTDSSDSTFARSEENFERRGLKLGPIIGLGDQAYYFSEQAGQSTVTTVVLLKGSLQVLITGTGTLDQIGSIAKYTLNQFELTHS